KYGTVWCQCQGREGRKRVRARNGAKGGRRSRRVGCRSGFGWARGAGRRQRNGRLGALLQVSRAHRLIWQERAMNPVEIAALDALDLLVVVDNESDTLSSVDKGVPQLPELGRLVARAPHRAPIDGHDCVEPWGHLCLACHGFSALVTGWRGSEERSVLFDVGPSAAVWLENARRLGVRLASIEAVCLSHWHADHSGGL